MSKLKCVECQHSEYDEYFHELRCNKKGKEVQEDDTCDMSQDRNAPSLLFRDMRGI